MDYKTILNKAFPYGNWWFYPLFLIFSIAMTWVFLFVPLFCSITWQLALRFQGIEFSDPNNMIPLINILLIFNWKTIGIITGIYFFSSLIMDGYLYLKANILFHSFPTNGVD